MAALLDLLGRRNALRVLWELRDGHAQTFRTLRASCDDVSPTVLNTRLKELRQAGLVTQGSPAGYRLTVQGQTLLVKLGPLNGWANRWATRAE
jgi:DNA-binding HxlR family transcriptional regulator